MSLERVVLNSGFLPSALLAICVMQNAEARLVSDIHDYNGSADFVLPAKLSQTGLYDNVASKSRAISAGITPYSVNSPLWSDGSFKERFITLPPGTKVVPTDSDRYAFPDKSVLIKNFSIDTVYGNSASRILVETRFLVVRMEGTRPVYNGISYKWRRDQTEAELVGRSGLDTVHMVIMGGIPRGKRWNYPSPIQCRSCHFGRGVLGFITPQLNRMIPSGGSSINQLQALATAGILASNPLAGKPAPGFRWAGLEESGSQSLEMRARSYFASNCSHCHGNGNSPEGSEHNFDFYRVESRIAGDTAGAYVGRTSVKAEGFPQLVYPGYPESSLVVMRMMARKNGWEMPVLATYQMDSAAVKVVGDWICSLGGRTAACKLPEVQPDSAYWEKPPTSTGARPRYHASRAAGPRFKVEGLTLTLNGKAQEGSVSLFDFHGRAVPLRPLPSGKYGLESALPVGIYFLKMGSGVSQVQYLP